MNIKTMEELKEKIPKDINLDEEVETKRELFKYSYECNTEYKQRRIGKEESIELMYLFFGRENAMMNSFIEYLKKDETKAMTRDEWNNLYEFLRTIKEDYSNYDVSGESSWPLLFDNFVNNELGLL